MQAKAGKKYPSKAFFVIGPDILQTQSDIFGRFGHTLPRKPAALTPSRGACPHMPHCEGTHTSSTFSSIVSGRLWKKSMPVKASR